MGTSFVHCRECRMVLPCRSDALAAPEQRPDRKSTRLNSSHSQISYAVFCLKKKSTQRTARPAPSRCPPACSPSRRTAPDTSSLPSLVPAPPSPPLFPYTTLFRSWPYGMPCGVILTHIGDGHFVCSLS